MLALAIGVIAGIASTVQASVNTEARRFFRSPFITAGLNFMVAWLCLAAFIIFTEHRLSVPVGEIAKKLGKTEEEIKETIEGGTDNGNKEQ